MHKGPGAWGGGGWSPESERRQPPSLLAGLLAVAQRLFCRKLGRKAGGLAEVPPALPQTTALHKGAGGISGTLPLTL